MVHKPFAPFKHDSIVASSSSCEITPTQLRWSPFDLPAEGEKVDFVQGIKTVSVAGDPTAASGLAIHIYTANTNMDHKAFYNSDGDILIGKWHGFQMAILKMLKRYSIVPQQGRLDICTEFGKMMVAPNEICVIQRGIRYSVSLPDGPV